MELRLRVGTRRIVAAREHRKRPGAERQVLPEPAIDQRV
jgi:hypothetical protein